MTAQAPAPEQGAGALVILVPVLERPHRVAPLLASIQRATPQPHTVLFLPDPDDAPQREAIRISGAEQLPVKGGYARKINTGVKATCEPLLFFAADDLHFHPGWLTAANARMRDGVQAVGVNDTIPRRHTRQTHATHFLVARDYATQPCINGEPGPLFEGYDHNYVDDEFAATAQQRGVYAYAHDSIVEHHHTINGLADDDATYQKGRARFDQDRRLFLRRRRKWIIR